MFRVGDVLDRTYEIRGLLGRGGMGEVYDAFDRRLQRAVAIKIANADAANDSTAIRNEARALAAIRHPSVIAVFASGEHEGVEYVVMERVLGENLQTHIRKFKAFPLIEALSILSRVSEGLAVVHQSGIAHRDVKPDNVVLAPGGRAVLMDFGVFIAEFDAASAMSSGSPAYMAPETIRGTVGSGDAFLVDIYAFGVLAFELLTGELPFVSTSARDLYMSHLSEPVPRVRDRRAEVPQALDDLVYHLMAKDPLERPQGMDEVSHRLRRLRFNDHEPGPVSVRNPGGPPSGRLSTGRIRVEEVAASTEEERTTHTRRRP